MRLASGILLGLDLFIFTKLGISLDTKRLVFVAAALVTVFMGSIGKLCISHREKRL